MAVSRQIDFLLAGLIDSDGLPLSAGKVETYNAGTLTSRTTWTDQSKTTPAANPIILDSLGQAKVFGDGAYKFIIKRSDDTTLTTLDNIIINEQTAATLAGTTAGTATAYTATFSPSPTAYSDGLTLQILFHTISGASPTLNGNALGAVPLRRPNGTAVPASVLRTGILYTVVYYSGAFIVQDCSTPWIDYAPAFTGFTVNPTNAVYRYQIDSSGCKCTVLVQQNTPGTSGATTFTISAPVVAATVTNATWRAFCSGHDNGAALTTPGSVNIASATGVFIIYKDASGAGFTATNAKSASFIITYEI